MPPYQRVGRQIMGERLRRALEDAGLSPTQVAAELGYTTGGIAHWISGRGEIPSGYLPALSHLTGKPIPYFLGLDQSESFDFPHKEPTAQVTQLRQPLHLIGPELAFARGLGEMAAEYGKDLEMDVLDYREGLPPAGIASRLGIPSRDRALYRARVQMIDGYRVRWIGSWMPLDLFGPIADQRPTNRPLFDVFEEQTGIQITKVEERLRIMDAQTAGMTHALHLPDHEALVAIQRLVSTSINRIAEFAMIYAVPAYWEWAYRYPAGKRLTEPTWSWVEGSGEPLTTAPS